MGTIRVQAMTNGVRWLGLAIGEDGDVDEDLAAGALARGHVALVEAASDATPPSDGDGTSEGEGSASEGSASEGEGEDLPATPTRRRRSRASE